MIDPAVREQAVISLLSEWPWESGGTLIGGYAIAAYGPARYSDDVDFAIPLESRAAIEQWLNQRGFAPPRDDLRRTGQVFENALRLERDPITLDLLLGFVRDREAKADIPEEWISLRPRRLKVDFLSGRVETPVRVARPEAMWALKLQAGRDQDLTDLFAISGEPVDAKEVASVFRSLMRPSLAEKLRKVLARLEVRKLYDDARSRLGLKDTIEANKRWRVFQARAAEMVPSAR